MMQIIFSVHAIHGLEFGFLSLTALYKIKINLNVFYKRIPRLCNLTWIFAQKTKKPVKWISKILLYILIYNRFCEFMTKKF